MQEVAPLTESREVCRGVVSNIVVEVGASQHDPRPARFEVRRQIRWRSKVRANQTPLPVSPAPYLLIEPASIAKVADETPMRPGTMLTAALGTTEPDRA